MEITVIDGAKFQDMLLGGARLLEENKAHVDALNVFPVPDGDTGTNMALTMAAAVKEIKRVNSGNVGSVAEAAARGSLMGARGNSGVILSQLIRGIFKELKYQNRVDTITFAAALNQGYRTASEAVMKPMEGTILTVAREAAGAALKAAKRSGDFSFLFTEVLEKARITLERTPEMLPVLKQAGVVDAGAKGWLLILEGMYRGLTQDNINSGDAVANTVTKGKAALGQPLDKAADFVSSQEGAIEFVYCTELLIVNASTGTERVRAQLAGLGDSLLVVGDEETIKVHIHSNNPGKVLERCLEIGSLDKIKIENMVIQKAAIKAESGQKAPYGFLAVSSGEGLNEIFRNLGVQQVVSGGQTNNPSTADLVKAIEAIDAEVIYILPNNGNVLLTATQAAKLVKARVDVIPTRSVPAGIAALIAFQPEKEPEVNLERMKKALASVTTAEVTYAVRDTNVDGHMLKEGDIIGIVNDRIVTAGRDVAEVTRELIRNIINEDSEIVTIYAGQDTTDELVQEISQRMEDEFPEIEFESHYGGQPLYYFLISVE